MSAEVVVMPGVSKPSVPAHEQVVPGVADIARHIHAEAEQGRVRAIAVAYVDDNGLLGTLMDFTAPEQRRNDLIAAVVLMQNDLLQAVREHSGHIPVTKA